MLLNSIGGYATKNAAGPAPRELHTHESPLVNEEQYRPPVSTSVFNPSLRGIELYFLPQVNSEIWRERQTPKVLAKLQTSQGRETQKNSEVGIEEDVLNQSQHTMPAGSGDKDQIRACICDLRSIAQFTRTISSIIL